MKFQDAIGINKFPTPIPLNKSVIYISHQDLNTCMRKICQEKKMEDYREMKNKNPEIFDVIYLDEFGRHHIECDFKKTRMFETLFKSLSVEEMKDEQMRYYKRCLDILQGLCDKQEDRVKKIRMEKNSLTEQQYLTLVLHNVDECKLMLSSRLFEFLIFNSRHLYCNLHVSFVEVGRIRSWILCQIDCICVELNDIRHVMKHLLKRLDMDQESSSDILQTKDDVIYDNRVNKWFTI